MGNYDSLKGVLNIYKNFGLSRNPFSIAPLFQNFKQEDYCQKEEDLFIFPQESVEEAKIFLSAENQRILVYGLYGTGKTSFVDFLLYLAYNFHHRFCTRVVVSEDNLERAIHEILITLCFDIVSEIEKKRLLHPLEAIKKWIAGEKYLDVLMGYLQKLIGKYTEHHEESKASKKQAKVAGNLGLCSSELSYESELEIRKSIQTYVETLPLKQVAGYLVDLLRIAQFIGFKDVVIFIDEADHLPEVDAFLRLLTRSREVLFTPGYTFFIAGSVELAKHTEAMGAIFDKLVFLKPANFNDLEKIIAQRIHAVNPKLSSLDIFCPEVLQEIFVRSKGIRKNAMRLAENSLERAVLENGKKVTLQKLIEVLQTGYDEVLLEISPSQTKILKFLAQNGATSPSEVVLQNKIQLTRTRLRSLLEDLFQRGYVGKQKKGRSCLYQISNQYQAYFSK